MRTTEGRFTNRVAQRKMAHMGRKWPALYLYGPVTWTDMELGAHMGRSGARGSRFDVPH